MKARLMLGLIGLAALAVAIAPLAGATREAPIPPYSVVFSNGTTQLKVLTVGVNANVDVAWKDGACHGGYTSPPVVLTWSGPTGTGGVTDPTAAPWVAPCTSTVAPDDINCVISDVGHIPICWPTSKHAAGSGGPQARIANPSSSEDANLFLYKRTILSAMVKKPGQTKYTTTPVPAGANAVHWYGPDGG